MHTRAAIAVQHYECAQRSDLSQKAKYFVKWHSWSSARRQKEGTEEHATYEFVRWRLSGGFREWMSRTSTMARVREYNHALIGEMQGFYLARAAHSWRQFVHERKTTRATEDYTCAAMIAYEQKTLLRRLHLCALARRQQVRHSVSIPKLFSAPGNCASLIWCCVGIALLSATARSSVAPAADKMATGTACIETGTGAKVWAVRTATAWQTTSRNTGVAQGVQDMAISAPTKNGGSKIGEAGVRLGPKVSPSH